MKITTRLFLITVLFQMLFTACGQNPTVIQLSSVEFSKQIKKDNAILLDVRTLQEYKNGYINNSGQLNFYAYDFNQKLLMLPKDQPIYLYCNTGYRSNRAANVLAQNGYTEVYNLKRGIMEWNYLKLPVLRDNDAKADLNNYLNHEQFNKLINSDTLTFIDFYAPWCGPCRKMMPMMDSLKVEYKNSIKIIKINTDASKELIKELGIIGVPYLVLYKKGEIVFSKKGLISRKDLVGTFESELTNKK